MNCPKRSFTYSALAIAGILTGTMATHASLTALAYSKNKDAPRSSFLVSKKDGSCFVFRNRKSISVDANLKKIENTIPFSNDDEPILIYPFNDGENTYFNTSRCEEVR